MTISTALWGIERFSEGFSFTDEGTLLPIKGREYNGEEVWQRKEQEIENNGVDWRERDPILRYDCASAVDINRFLSLQRISLQYSSPMRQYFAVVYMVYNVVKCSDCDEISRGADSCSWRRLLGARHALMDHCRRVSECLLSPSSGWQAVADGRWSMPAFGRDASNRGFGHAAPRSLSAALTANESKRKSVTTSIWAPTPVVAHEKPTYAYRPRK